MFINIYELLTSFCSEDMRIYKLTSYKDFKGLYDLLSNASYKEFKATLCRNCYFVQQRVFQGLGEFLGFTSWGLVRQAENLSCCYCSSWGSLQLLTHPQTSHVLALLTPRPRCVSLTVVTVRDGAADTKALKRQAFVFALLLFLPSVSVSLPLWPLQPIAMWPTDPRLDWSLTAIKALSHFTMTATGQNTS